MHAREDRPFGILNYHRITPHVPGVATPTWNVAPERFRDQLGGLIDRGFDPWPLSRVLEHRAAGMAIPRRTFVVTFDDAYDNIYRNAFPVLKELSAPATVFITTDYLDARRPFAFDDWSAGGSDAVPESSWRPLTTAHCEAMLESGLVEIGSHTHTHADFRNRPESFRRDLIRSIQIIEDRFGVGGVPFAYPFGYNCKNMRSVVSETGVTCALTTDPKIVVSGNDPFCWGRFNVGRFDSAATLTLKLSGWTSWLHFIRRRLRPVKRCLKKYMAGRGVSRHFDKNGMPIHNPAYRT